jgi:hypothetical protein
MAADVATKLQLKPEQHVLVLEPPKDAAKLLSGVTRAKGGERPDAVLLFARSQTVVEANAATLRDHARAGEVVWAAYPKRSSGVTTDLTRDRGWGALSVLGLHPVRQVAIDEVWSALRFRFADLEAPPAH